MGKYSLLSTCLVLGLLSLSSVEAETIFGESSIKAEVFLNSEIPPLIPAPGPDEEVEFPEVEGELGLVAIRYISNLNFGITNVTQKKNTVYLPFDRDVIGGDAHNSVVIQDYSGNQNGWSLVVQLDTTQMKGAVLTFLPEWANGSALGGEEFYITPFIQLNEDSQLFASTDVLTIGINTFILSKGIKGVQNSGVSLEVPANVSGEIDGDLTWTLIAGPS